MEDKCTGQTAARDELREKGRRCAMRSRKGEGGGSTILPSRSKLSAWLGHPAPELPFDKLPPPKTCLFTPSSTLFCLACAGGMSWAVLSG